MSHALRRLEPETYIQKAEADIRRIQLACSLAEPPWDGYCGLVQVSEEDVSTDGGGSPDRASTASGATHLTGASPFSRPELATPPPSLASPAKPAVAPEQETTDSILRQIRSIAATPREGRQARLQALARQAVSAAAASRPQAALQLLELAQAACPVSDAQLRGEIAAELQRVKQAAAGAASPDAAQQQGSSPASAREPEGQGAAAAEPQTAAAAANRHFMAAKDLIKRGRLAQALAELDAAFRSCPPNRGEARRQIERHRAAVQAALLRQTVS